MLYLVAYISKQERISKGAWSDLRRLSYSIHECVKVKFVEVEIIVKCDEGMQLASSTPLQL